MTENEFSVVRKCLLHTWNMFLVWTLNIWRDRRQNELLHAWGSRPTQTCVCIHDNCKLTLITARSVHCIHVEYITLWFVPSSGEAARGFEPSFLWRFSQIGIFNLFVPVTWTLTRWPSYVNLTRINWIHTGCANGGFRKWSSNRQTGKQTKRQTRPKLYTMPLRGWSKIRRRPTIFTHAVRQKTTTDNNVVDEERK